MHILSKYLKEEVIMCLKKGFEIVIDLYTYPPFFFTRLIQLSIFLRFQGIFLSWAPLNPLRDVGFVKIKRPVIRPALP